MRLARRGVSERNARYLLTVATADNDPLETSVVLYSDLRATLGFPKGCLSNYLCEVPAMREVYQYKLASLRREIEVGGARPAVIDTAVSELLLDGDENLARDLLSLLSDNAEHDEGMFSLIHAAESSDDSSYVCTLLSVFPRLVSSAPRWASIVLMRVLNSGSAQLEMVRQLRDASAPVKESVREMCKRINEVNPQFLCKTVPVTLAAS